MNMTKLLLTISIFFLASCGTTGHISFYDFNVPKAEVEKEIMLIINSDSTYAVPKKWLSHTSDDYFKRIYIYFKDKPEELYQIGFTNEADWQHSPSSRLGLISVYSGQQFQYESDLSKKELQRITKRFETQILSKVKCPYSRTE